MRHNAHSHEPYPHGMILGMFVIRQDTPARRAGTIAIVSSVPSDAAVRRNRPPPSSSRQNDGCSSPPGATTARSEPARTRSNLTPWHLESNELPGIIDDSMGPSSAIMPSSCDPGAAPRTSRSEGDAVAARTATRSASIPSAMCTVASGVAATCLSPRSNLGVWARQLDVATQYLNRSLVVPTRPRQQNNSSSGRRARPRPATAETVRTGRGFSAEPGCDMEGSRSQTTSAGGRLERRRNHTHLDGRSRSSGTCGDCRYRDLNEAPGLSARPLASARTASSGACRSPSRCSAASVSPSPRGPVVVASPRIEQRETPLGWDASSPRLEGTPGAPPPGSPSYGPPRQQSAANRGFEPGVNVAGEVGYTISSAAAAAGGLASEGNGHGNGTPTMVTALSRWTR